MSRDNHPNIHAVLFVTALARIVFGEKRTPETVEILDAYFKSIRGGATPETNIDLDGMMHHFQTMIADRLQVEDYDVLSTLLSTFACEVSSRLDEVIDAGR